MLACREAACLLCCIVELHESDRMKTVNISLFANERVCMEKNNNTTGTTWKKCQAFNELHDLNWPVLVLPVNLVLCTSGFKQQGRVVSCFLHLHPVNIHWATGYRKSVPIQVWFCTLYYEWVCKRNGAQHHPSSARRVARSKPPGLQLQLLHAMSWTEQHLFLGGSCPLATVLSGDVQILLEQLPRLLPWGAAILYLWLLDAERGIRGSVVTSKLPCTSWELQEALLTAWCCVHLCKNNDRKGALGQGCQFGAEMGTSETAPYFREHWDPCFCLQNGRSVEQCSKRRAWASSPHHPPAGSGLWLTVVLLAQLGFRLHRDLPPGSDFLHSNACKNFPLNWQLCFLLLLLLTWNFNYVLPL